MAHKEKKKKNKINGGVVLGNANKYSLGGVYPVLAISGLQ